MTKAEFYKEGTNSLQAVVHDAGAIPREGDLINIRKKTYKVTRVTWCVDSPEVGSLLRANVDLKAMKGY